MVHAINRLPAVTHVYAGLRSSFYIVEQQVPTAQPTYFVGLHSFFYKKAEVDLFIYHSPMGQNVTAFQNGKPTYVLVSGRQWPLPGLTLKCHLQ